ncbi:putative 1-phosphatidylinositol-3-phosphate 5-kinase [Chlorella vulgaris]
MPGGQQDGQNGKRARDAALTWDLPPPLEEAEAAAPAGRPAFSAVAGRHLEALVAQLLTAEGVQADRWTALVCQLAQKAADALSPTAAVAHGKLDPRYYVKVKRLVTADSEPAHSSWVQGVVCRKSLAHKRMRSSIVQPRIMLLAGAVEPQATQGALSASASKLSSFGALLDQEQQYLSGAVDRIASFQPDVLLVERSVARYAQELLLARDISLVLNVKRELLERLARCIDAQVAPSLDQLTSHSTGFCKLFEVESLQPAGGAAAAAAATTAAATAAATPSAVSTEVSPRAAEEGHLVADAAALASNSLRKTQSAAGQQPAGPRALMTFSGCPRKLGSTIVLRGSDAGELRRVKRVTAFAAYAAYWGLLESALLSDQLAAAAAAVLPGGGQAEAVAGLADAVASSSFLAAAEARGRQAILSASAHVSVVLERGRPAAEVELPQLEDSNSQGGVNGGGGAAAAWADESSPDSPVSCDSTNMWVVPAEAGTATFTVSGSLSLEEEAAALQQQRQQQRQEQGASTPPARSASWAACDMPPDSPQDPLHQAAKEAALRQLQLTGSEPPSPATAAVDAVSAMEAQPGGSSPPSQQRQQMDAGSGDSESTAAQLAHGVSAASAQLTAADRDALALVAAAEASGGTSLGPGALAYSAQQLWLSISCKNPAKGILFAAGGLHQRRRAAQPQCGDGAPLHLRSFVHGNGLVTLSSVRLPAGKELPDGRVWMWLRPAGAAAGGGGEAAPPAAARRVPLSPEAACLSFAHLLSLLLDARHLSLGGLSLQRDYVRYLGAGCTVLCLHYSPAVSFDVLMPPRQVGLLPEAEEEWLQDEIKQLTEEADEAFGAIQYALGQQLQALEVGGAEPEPEFAQMWTETLADTRGTFLDTVQDTISQLDGSPRAGEGQQQQAERVVGAVWELNRLRSLLAAVVLQWATCLHEGTPSSHAAPPSGASAIAMALQKGRAAAHSRNVSAELTSTAVAASEEPQPPVQPELEPSPFSQLAQQQQGTDVQQLQPEAGSQRQQPPPPHQQNSAALPPLRVAMQRRDSSASLGRQFLEAAERGGPPQPSTISDFNFGAPSLHGFEEGGGGGGSLAASPHGSFQAVLPASIPTGLVARYITMFDSTRGGGGSNDSGNASPSGKAARTLDWVRTNSPAAGEPGAAAAAAVLAHGGTGLPPGMPAATDESASSSYGGGAIALPAAGDVSGGREGQQAAAPAELQQQERQRSSFFRLDLSNPDPELVKALTPKQRSTSEEAEVAGLLPSSSSSRLELLSARLGQMSLSKSFTERRRSSSSALIHSQSADQAVLEQQLAAVAEQRQQQPPPPPQQQQQQQQQAAQPRQQQGMLPPRPQPDRGSQPLAADMPGGGASVQADALAGAAESALAAVESEEQLGLEPSGLGSVSHWDEWTTLLDDVPAPARPSTDRARSTAPPVPPLATPPGSGSVAASPRRMPRAASADKLAAISRLQEAPMPPDLPAPGSAFGDAAAAASGEVQQVPPAAAGATAGAGEGEGEAAPPVLAAAKAPAGGIAAVPAPLMPTVPPPPSRASSFVSTRSAGGGGGPASAAGSSAGPSPPAEKPPNKLLALLGRLRNDLQPGHMPLTAGKVELSGRALLPSGSGGLRVSVFDEEPTSIVAYFLSSKRRRRLAAEAVQQLQQQQQNGGVAAAEVVTTEGAPLAATGPAADQGVDAAEGGGAGVAAAAPQGSAQAAALPPPLVPPPASGRVASREEAAAEQGGDWRVLFHENQLDCQLALEDPSPGMPWGRAKFQTVAYYAPQFSELRRRCVAGGEAAFLASISRCRKWASRGGKSAAYFARSCDKRYIVKQLSKSERQSFLEFAPDYFRYLATMLHRGQDTCLAKVLGVYQVSVQYTGGRGAPTAPPFGGKEGTMDLLITENVFYGREASMTRIYDLKGSQRDRYASDNPGVAGAVLLDENLKELNLASPTLVGPRAFARLQRALWSDTSFLSGLGVMDYSLLVGVDKRSQELVVGVIDYIRQYTWDKQVETWVKKSGILGGAGKDPTVISPKQYSRRFRIAMSSYLTVAPAWEAPEPPLDPDAV